MFYLRYGTPEENCKYCLVEVETGGIYKRYDTLPDEEVEVKRALEEVKINKNITVEERLKAVEDALLSML